MYSAISTMTSELVTSECISGSVLQLRANEDESLRFDGP